MPRRSDTAWSKPGAAWCRASEAHDPFAAASVCCSTRGGEVVRQHWHDERDKPEPSASAASLTREELTTELRAVQGACHIFATALTMMRDSEIQELQRTTPGRPRSRSTWWAFWRWEPPRCWGALSKPQPDPAWQANAVKAPAEQWPRGLGLRRTT